MIRRIVLENFMTHVRTVIEPAEGLTILTGPNNCGKSAVVLALQCLNTNDKSSKFIRHGQKEAKVTVETSEGSRICFTRAQNFATYQINEREISRTRRPEDLDEHLRCALVTGGETRNVQFDLHFADQKNPIFLVGGKGADAATFFAASSDAGYLLEMQKLLATKMFEARGDRRRAEERIATLEKQAAAFTNLTETEQRVRKVEDAHHDLLEVRNRVSALRSLIAKLDDAETSSNELTAQVKALGNIKEIPAQADVKALRRLVEDLKRLDQERETSKAQSDSLAKLVETPQLANPTPLVSHIAAVKGRLKQLSLLGPKIEVVAKMQSPPTLADTAPLARLVSQIHKIQAGIQTLSESASIVENEQREFESLAQRWVQENPTCPTCGGQLTPEKVLDHLGVAHV
ncbi:MAG: AAA family ATPase [Fimbriimonadaceae bacterium]